MNLLGISILIFFLSSVFFISDAFAYIDPGSGSMLLQALIGVFVGIAITLKIYWYKLKEKFFTSSQKDK